MPLLLFLEVKEAAGARQARNKLDKQMDGVAHSVARKAITSQGENELLRNCQFLSYFYSLDEYSMSE